MADQGDIIRAGLHPTQRPFTYPYTSDHLWKQTRAVKLPTAYLTSHTDTKRISVTAAITGATANAYITLSRNGVNVINTRANGSGAANFYDLDDSNNHLYYASEIGSTKAWSVQVVNTTVTVTALSAGGGGTSSHGYAG